ASRTRTQIPDPGLGPGRVAIGRTPPAGPPGSGLWMARSRVFFLIVRAATVRVRCGDIASLSRMPYLTMHVERRAFPSTSLAGRADEPAHSAAGRLDGRADLHERFARRRLSGHALRQAPGRPEELHRSAGAVAATAH